MERVVCARTLLPLTRTLLPPTWCLEPGASSLGGNPRPGLLSHLSPFQTFTFTCWGVKGKMVKDHLAVHCINCGSSHAKSLLCWPRIFSIYRKIHSPSLFFYAEQIEFLVLLLAALSVVKCVQLGEWQG